MMTTFVQWCNLADFHLSGKEMDAIDKFSNLQSGWINDGAITLRFLGSLSITIHVLPQT